MVEGIIKQNKPLVQVTVASWLQGVKDVLALVDTGFTGDLSISKETMEELGLGVRSIKAVTFGDEKVKNMPFSKTSMYVGKRKCDVDVLIAGEKGRAKIGIGLLTKLGFKLEVDYRNDSVRLS
ncbi:hypothetical protein KJ885_00350 [Patescibacteria group bacterium]|nr:hypothetical protein [Patescibacteria group bacterium]